MADEKYYFFRPFLLHHWAAWYFRGNNKYHQNPVSNATWNPRSIIFSVKGMLRLNIEHFLKKCKYEKLGFSEVN